MGMVAFKYEIYFSQKLIKTVAYIICNHLLIEVSISVSGMEQISEAFGVCNGINSDADYDHFLRWIRNAFVVMTMIDYPFPRGNFPAFPVKVKFLDYHYCYIKKVYCIMDKSEIQSSA